jgi:hypothetical protein
MQTLLDSMGAEFLWGQVIIRQDGNGFALRHLSDKDRSEEDLETVEDLRKIAMHRSDGAFRPLKSAPNVRPGWHAKAKDISGLEAALNHLYPGSIADWFAARATEPPVTNYREFTNRQSGMYRTTQMLNDAQAANVIKACCLPRLCLKQRIWTVSGLKRDPTETKSAIPCLEPCAVLLEFARKAMRIEQEEKMTVQLSASEAATLGAALEKLMNNPELLGREGDTSSPLNPRRVQLLLEKHAELFHRSEPLEPEEP